MKTLGINSLTHDTSAAIFEDGKLIAAVEEERFTQKKHCSGIECGEAPPYNAIKWVLAYSETDPDDVDIIAHPAPYGFEFLANSDIAGVGVTNTKFENFIKELDKSKLKTRRVDHHLSHAASAFYLSGFESSNILTIDGAGESVATGLYVGTKSGIELIREYPYGQSLGFLYTKLGIMLGLGEFNDCEGKLMGLSAYGKFDEHFAKIAKVLKHDYRLDRKEIKKLERFLRTPEREITQVHKNIASTLQKRVEEISTELVDYLYSETGSKNLCLAGGVALNCVMNGVLRELPFVENIYVQPAAGDAGTALGAALQAYAEEGHQCKFRMDHAYWGPEYSNDEIESVLRLNKLSHVYHDDIARVAAELLSQGKIIGWFQGRMEFGPRALGNRSILADPRDPKMKDKINYFVKHREPWRPFAPSILNENMDDYVENSCESPFMTLNFRIKKEKQKEIPSVVHVDGTARVQSVNKKTNPKYHELISEFASMTGVPVLLNTSFNDRGMPIVRSPTDAIKHFYSSGMDFLVLGNYLLKK